MPSLSETLRESVPGYAPAPAPKPLPPLTQGKGTGNFGVNPSIRCPLPPLNIGPDTLRQFDESQGIAPKRRVIPLPAQTGLSSAVQTVTKTTTVVSSTSSSSTSTALTTKTVTYNSPILAIGGSDLQVITMAKSYQLISVVANNPCEMRLYGSTNSQVADFGRATDAPLAAELLSNMVTDLVFDTAPYTWSWQNRVGVNSDSLQSTNCYITVFNTGASPAQIQITIVFLPLET